MKETKQVTPCDLFDPRCFSDNSAQVDSSPHVDPELAVVQHLI